MLDVRPEMLVVGLHVNFASLLCNFDIATHFNLPLNFVHLFSNHYMLAEG
jgi:hypothetical protein